MAVAPLLCSLALLAGQDSAYLDPAARLLVERARARRQSVDRSIRTYTTEMTERIGVGIRALRRDRMMFRRELALKITWNRDTTGTVAVIGAREAVPFALKGVRLPDNLTGQAVDYAFDPSASRLMLGGSGDSSFLIHPLAPGSEEHYRFQSGDSTLLTFPDERRLRLYELRIIPRRLDARLVVGALWIEGDGYGVVRLLTRLARPFDFDLDVRRRPRERGDTAVRGDSLDDDDDDVPGFLKPIKADARFFAIEYGLWHNRWWLPRLVAFDGVASIGGLATFPMRYELTYTNYTVEGDSLGVPPPPADSAVPNDTARARCRERYGEGVDCRCRNGRCFTFTVTVPPDTQGLLASVALPPAFATTADSMITEQEIQDLAAEIRGLPAVPWGAEWRPPRWGLARYNRIEALSLGARGELDFGRLSADGVVRLGAADLVPNVELGVARPGVMVRPRLAGYYRLAAADTTVKPFGILNSFNALFVRRDDGQYFRALGVELHARPEVTQPQTWAWRVYAERQRPVAKETDVSLPHLFDRAKDFRPNIAADTADQLGATVAFRVTRAFGAGQGSVGTDLLLDGGTGTFDFFRTALTLRATLPLPGPLAGGLEVAGGTADGRLPVQSLWYLGGAQTLRGYEGGVAAGTAFWRARTEVANDFPAFRVALFADAGKTGTRENLSTRHALLGVGAGISFLDGLVRLDFARATRSPTGFRVDLYFDGVL